MKKLINLMCEHLKIKIETKKLMKGNLQEFYKLLTTFGKGIDDMFTLLEYVKANNFKDIYYEEHEKNKDLEKEVRRLKKELKSHEDKQGTKK